MKQNFSVVYVISHRPGYGAWVTSFSLERGEMAPASKVKIGYTSGKVSKRRSGLAATHRIDALDLRIELEQRVGTAREAKAVEKGLHAHFAKSAIGREWFRLSQTEIDAIPELVRTAHKLAKEGRLNDT